MAELFRSSLPFVGPVLVPALLLLLAPLSGRRARSAFAVVFAVLGLGFLVDVLVFDHSAIATLDVPNVFPRAPDGEPHVWRVARSSAPHWHWHVFAAGLLLFGAAVLWLRRNRPPVAPRPALHGAMVFLVYLGARLGLEHFAAFEALVWATSVMWSLLLILPFVGWYCGRRGSSFRGWLGQLALMAVLQRVPLVAWAYWATTRQQGTHLDTHRVTDAKLPLSGVHEFGTDAVRGWLNLTAIPQLTFLILVTVVGGVLLGGIPFLIARRRAAGERS